MKLDIFFKAILSKLQLSKANAISVPVPHSARVLLHWKILVIAFSLAVVSVFVDSYVTYQDISQGDFVAPVGKVNTENTKASAELLKKTADFFRKKSQTFGDLRKNPVNSTDPSR